MSTPALRRHLTKRRQRRDALWPDADNVIFSGEGWARMPRTVPMIASFIDVLGGRLSPGRLFVALFAYDFGDGFVEVDPLSLALDAGYSRHRAERSVAERLRLLEKLGFVRATAIGHREHGALLLLDPHPVVLRIRREFPELVDDAWWSAFVDRCRVVGIPLPDEAPNDPG